MIPDIIRSSIAYVEDCNQIKGMPSNGHDLLIGLHTIDGKTAVQPSNGHDLLIGLCRGSGSGQPPSMMGHLNILHISVKNVR
jgi:hypothetical protein